MSRFSADVTLCATLYVTANTPESARAKFAALVGTEREPVDIQLARDLPMDSDGSFLSASITSYGADADTLNECDW